MQGQFRHFHRWGMDFPSSIDRKLNMTAPKNDTSYMKTEYIIYSCDLLHWIILDLMKCVQTSLLHFTESRKSMVMDP